MIDYIHHHFDNTIGNFFGKYGIISSVIIFILSIYEHPAEIELLKMSGLQFFEFAALWLFRFVVGSAGAIGIYEYFMDKIRYKQWADAGYKVDDKPKFKIK